ncbi:MAG: molybdenum ABC transporter ATP-binding protein [Pontibacterium sp.]
MSLVCNITLSRVGFELKANFELPNQGIHVLFGPSGSGKSTLLRCLAGLETPDSGQLTVNDQLWFSSQNNASLPSHQRCVGMVFQSPQLMPHLSVKENLMFSPRYTGKHYEQVVSTLKIKPLLNKRCQQLSGGEQQRVAIGRALLSEPQYLLMDEPLSALDASLRLEIMALIKQLSRALTIPVIYVTHQLEEVQALADTLLLIEKGVTSAQGPLSELWHHSSFREAIGPQHASSLFQAVCTAKDTAYGLSQVTLSSTSDSQNINLWLAEDLAVGQSVRLVIYASDVSIAPHTAETSARNQLTCSIAGVDHNAASSTLTLLCQGQVLYARITRWSFDQLALELGDTVVAHIKTVAIRCLV